MRTLAPVALFAVLSFSACERRDPALVESELRAEIDAQRREAERKEASRRMEETLEEIAEGAGEASAAARGGSELRQHAEGAIARDMMDGAIDEYREQEEAQERAAAEASRRRSML